MVKEQGDSGTKTISKDRRDDLIADKNIKEPPKSKKTGIRQKKGEQKDEAAPFNASSRAN